MSDQPTNHRAQAESWLIEAVSHVNHGAEGFAISGALIGIGHWLGAIHDALLAGIDVLAEDEPTYRKPANQHDPRCPASRNYEAPCDCPAESEPQIEPGKPYSFAVTVPADARTPGLDAHIAGLLTEQLSEPVEVTDGRCTYTENSGGVQLRCDLTTGHPPFLRESGHRLRLNP